MSIKKGKDPQLADCDFCFNRKSRNAKIVHQLKMTETQFRDHLKQLHGEAGEKDGWISSRIQWHRFVWTQYGQRAKDNHVPLWQAYLEANGVKVKRKVNQPWINLPEKAPF